MSESLSSPLNEKENTNGFLNRKIGLLSITHPPDVGGVAIAIRRLAIGLANAGHDVHVFVPTNGQAAGQSTDVNHSITVHRIGPFKRTEDQQSEMHDAICAEHARKPFDVLHGYYIALTGFLTVFTGRYLGVPTVISGRGNDLDRMLFRPELTHSIVWAISNSDASTGVSNALVGKIKALVPASDPIAIHNGVDTELFQPGSVDLSLKERLGIPADSLIVGFVGEARKKKGLHTLLLAFAELCQRFEDQERPEPTLLFVGGIREKDQDALTLFRAKNRASRVVVVENLDHGELPAYYRLIDVVALPSLRDGLPNSLLEALACGRAVVATPVGGIPDVVTDGKTAVFVPVQDSQALADSLELLLSDPEKRERLGASGRQLILDRFKAERELEAVLSLYADVQNHI